MKSGHALRRRTRNTVYRAKPRRDTKLILRRGCGERGNPSLGSRKQSPIEIAPKLAMAGRRPGERWRLQAMVEGCRPGAEVCASAGVFRIKQGRHRRRERRQCREGAQLPGRFLRERPFILPANPPAPLPAPPCRYWLRPHVARIRRTSSAMAARASPRSQDRRKSWSYLVSA